MKNSTKFFIGLAIGAVAAVAAFSAYNTIKAIKKSKENDEWNDDDCCDCCNNEDCDRIDDKCDCADEKCDCEDCNDENYISVDHLKNEDCSCDEDSVDSSYDEQSDSSADAE